MLNEMFLKTQKEYDPVRVVIATLKEKPYDDIMDYPLELDKTYPINWRKPKDPKKATLRVVRRVRTRFDLE